MKSASKLIKFEPFSAKTTFAVIGIGFTLSARQFWFNTFKCDKKADAFRRRDRSGYPVKKLHSELLPLTTQVLKDFNFGTRLHKFEFFPCTGTETMHIGLHDVHKSYIGLPFYFEYKELEDIDEDEFVFISEQAPNWEREDGKQFLENLVLSENAKKYAIAESIALAYSMDTILQEKWKVSAAIRRFCSTLFGASILLSWLLLFKLGVDEYTKGVINDFINELATKQDYIDGGIEYHSKNHKREILLRESNDGLIAFFNMKYTHSQMIENLSKWAR